MGKGALEFFCHFIQRELSRLFPSDNDDVPRSGEFAGVVAEKFSEEPLDPVANDRITHPRADRDAQSVFSLVVRFAEDNKMGSVNLFSLSR